MKLRKNKKNDISIKYTLDGCKHYFVRILMSDSDFFATKDLFCQEKQIVRERGKDGDVM